MTTRNGTLDAKLCELERQYSWTVHQIHLSQRMEHEAVRRGLREVWSQFRENELFMQRQTAQSHSPAAAALSAAQVDYDLKIQHLLQDELPGYFRGAGNEEEQAEAAGLYAEYAIDYAAQSLRHALLAALSARDLELSCQEESAHLNDREEYTDE